MKLKKARVTFVCSGELACRFIEWANEQSGEGKVLTDSIEDDQPLTHGIKIGDWYDGSAEGGE